MEMKVAPFTMSSSLTSLFINLLRISMTMSNKIGERGSLPYSTLVFKRGSGGAFYKKQSFTGVHAMEAWSRSHNCSYENMNNLQKLPCNYKYLHISTCIFKIYNKIPYYLVLNFRT